MTDSNPPITGGTDPLPFDKKSPDEFERLCLWLVEREGYGRAEHLGAAGSEQGRDIVAWHSGKQWAFQCKRVKQFGPKKALEEARKVLALPERERPKALVFLVTCKVSATTRRKVRRYVGIYCGEEMECHFWAGDELDEKVKRHRDILEEFFQLPRTIEPGIPSVKAVAAHRAALRDRLERDAQTRWGGMSAYIQEEGATLPIQASPYQTGRLGPKNNLLQIMLAAGRLLVLGEPGSGKTVVLERLAWELCEGPQPTIPVLVRLFQYDGKSLTEWVRATLQETGQLRLDDEGALAAFLKEGEACCFFLFDGLNEVPLPHRRTLVGELVRWMKEYPLHPAILTSRPQDELWRRLREEVGQAVVIQLIEDEQAQAYLVAHLAERGEALYERLDPPLREMARTPFLLWLIKEAGAADESIPGNRGELYARFVSRMLQRDTDRRMDAEIPDPVKLGALTGLAYHLSLDQRLSCGYDEAVTTAAQKIGGDQADTVVGACRRHGLLAGEETVWFSPHQTVQEYFAALALQDLAAQERGQDGWKRLWRTGQRILPGRETGLAALASDDWWMETFVQLAGLTDDADRLAKETARVNPWLAWWCVEEGQEVSDETREAVEARSVSLMKSERVRDRRRAVATLARMQSERVVQPLFEAAADPDPEVAGLAMQALLEMGETVREQALALAQQPEYALYQGGLAYLGEVLGQPVVWVPPGPFWMGSDKDRDPEAHDDELPQHEVTLAGYWIGRYPVTVAQFRAFVEASGYQPGDKRSLGGEDDHPMVRVTWHEAVAYCRWLSDTTRLRVTLPSEAEWEKAARGTDGRIWPWGDEWDAERCNSEEGGVGGTTPVGKYSPQGDSSYGCADMAGNVWEWVNDWYDGDYYVSSPAHNPQGPEVGDVKVLRGGSWGLDGSFVRAANRNGSFNPDESYDRIGFRCVVALGE